MLQHSVVNTMLPNVVEFLSHHPLEGTDKSSIDSWKQSCQIAWSTITDGVFTSEEADYGTSLLATLLASYADLAHLVATKRHSAAEGWTLPDRHAAIQRLLNMPQIEQRTDAWYQDALGLLSASQFNTILKSGRTRGQLVLQKASLEPIDLSQRRTVVPTLELNPFTWGIRFEPIVKQIYQALTGTRVVDLGRLKHSVDRRLAASPDGLVVEGPDQRLARFVEFKAPVTRKILSVVPDDYMAQMQIQMEVGQVEECDYLEIKFISGYGQKVTQVTIPTENPTLFEQRWFYGNIHLIVNEETYEPIRYEYSPLNTLEWTPQLEEGEYVMEVIPWWTSEWFITTVGRSRTWFESVQPAINTFWEDVKKAKCGEFLLPASSRKSKEVKNTDGCMILEEPSATIAELLIAQ
jgi:hypothetical protein